MDLAIPNVMATPHNRGSMVIPMEPGEIIKKAREAKGLSQAGLGKKIGISQPAVKKIEAGDTRESKHLHKIARVLELDLDTIVPQTGPDASGILSRPYTSSVADFPIHASAEGGPGQIIMSSEPVDYMPRPAIFAHVSDSYGILVTGTSMEPEYRQGDTALVNKRLPVVNGEVYIFFGEHEGEGRATIKHLRKQTSDKWHVLQHNPPHGTAKEFTLSRREWQWAHRVLGKYSRR